MYKPNTPRYESCRATRSTFAIVMTVGIGLLMSGSVNANFIVSDSALLSDLVAGDSLIASGAEFSAWVVNNAVATGGALAIDPGAVTVQAGADGNQVGLQFLLAAAVGPGQIVNLDFTYEVSSDTPLGTAFSLMDAASANGTGVVSIAETLFQSFPGIPVGSLSVSTLDTGSLADETALDPALEMIVARKGVVLTGGKDGTASISSFFQLYEQVPEPAAGFSLMIGLIAGLGLMRRR